MNPLLVPGLFFLVPSSGSCARSTRTARAPGFGRSAVTWAILGLILGPIALMLLYLLPKHEAKPSHGHHAEEQRAELYERPKKS